MKDIIYMPYLNYSVLSQFLPLLLLDPLLSTLSCHCQGMKSS